MPKEETIKIGLFGKAAAIVLMTTITGLAGIGVNIGSAMYDKLEEINKTVTQLHVNMKYVDSSLVKMDAEISIMKERGRMSDLELAKLKTQFDDWKTRRRMRNSHRKP